MRVMANSRLGLLTDRNKSIKTCLFLTDKPVASNAVYRRHVRAFCDPLATPGDFTHRDRLYLSTVPSNGAHNHVRPNEESRSGGPADFKWPSLRICLRKRISRSGARGIIVGVHDRQREPRLIKALKLTGRRRFALRAVASFLRLIAGAEI